MPLREHEAVVLGVLGIFRVVTHLAEEQRRDDLGCRQAGRRVAAPRLAGRADRIDAQLRGGVLPQATRERIALAVAEHREDNYSIAQHAKSARRAGLGLDEVSRARSFTSADEKEAALLLFLKEALDADGPPPLHLHEEAREIGWTDEEILEAVGHLALNEFQSLIASAAALPKDQATPRVLPSAA